MTRFARYLGIDYSGAKTADRSLPGLRVYSATPDSAPVEILPPPSPRKYWTRRALAHWLRDTLRDGPPTLVGIDHAFSFPVVYFHQHDLAGDWPDFLADFHRHWPTDTPDVWVRDLLRPDHPRRGDSTWFRLTDRHARSAKSVFRFGVNGEVATSTHAGLPWVRFLRDELGSRVHWWPFDGWSPSDARSVVAEIYPTLWRQRFPPDDRTGDQRDAYAAARALRDADVAGELTAFFEPDLSAEERSVAAIEGWILGLR
jgi:hypothetical protein